MNVEDLDLELIPHQGVRDVLRFARSLGVRVVDLDEIGYDDWNHSITYDPDSQAWMKKHFKASRCPDGDHHVYVYASNGEPKTGRRGTLFIPSQVEDKEEWEHAFSYRPEVVLLHEIAHTIVGSEKRTCIWETEAVRVLFGESELDDSVWQGLQNYQGGADSYVPRYVPVVRQRLIDWGILPIQYPRINDERVLQLVLPL